MELVDIARCMNEIAAFVGPRDVAALDRASLERAGVPGGVADVAVLFGGSIVAGGDVFAQAMRAGVARRYVIVGGAGHTTETLRATMRRLHLEAAFADGASEADVFDAYLRSRYGRGADLLETRSTNCGNNVTYLLNLLRGQGIAPKSMIIVQDATMQRRMAAGSRCTRRGSAWSTTPLTGCGLWWRTMVRALARARASATTASLPACGTSSATAP